MDFQETINYLYQQLPVFQHIGAGALNPKLENTRSLLDHLGHPHQQFKSIHLAGTNGKGSTAHLVASVLQEAGYHVGLYTSPHLKSFTERIRTDGQEIDEQYVIDFVTTHKEFIEKSSLSFFELTVGMAFRYFADQQVDVAVIETGMGGRLDATNVITPLISVITNISADHQQYLGDTLEKIAFEKAGIIKPNVPVVKGENQGELDRVFINSAANCQAPYYDASAFEMVDYPCGLLGSYQSKNKKTAYTTLKVLEENLAQINESAIERGFAQVVKNTGLRGRWETIATNPLIICDTAHNEAGVKEIVAQLHDTTKQELAIVWGTVHDKDITEILKLLPLDAKYYFCQAKIQRAMPATELGQLAAELGLKGQVINDVNDAIQAAIDQAKEGTLIYVGGSTFVVAEIDDTRWAETN